MSVEFSVSSKIKFGEFIIKGLLNENREHSRTNVSLNLRESMLRDSFVVSIPLP